MAVMEFLGRNLVTTSTMIKVDSNTDLSTYMIDRNRRLGWSSNGYTGSTQTVISLEFGTPTVISHVMLQNHNLKDFRIFYNSVTANSLLVVSSNSQTSTYLSVNSITVSSVQIQIDAPMVAGADRQVGELIIAERQLQFERNPSIEAWDQSIFRKQIEHEMPDGGTVVFNIKDKYRADIAWQFITETFRNQLRSVFDSGNPVYFLPRPTSTSWDGDAYEVVWVGGFNFYFSDNEPSVGYSGSLTLKETPSG